MEIVLRGCSDSTNYNYQSTYCSRTLKAGFDIQKQHRSHYTIHILVQVLWAVNMLYSNLTLFEGIVLHSNARGDLPSDNWQSTLNVGQRWWYHIYQHSMYIPVRTVRTHFSLSYLHVWAPMGSALLEGYWCLTAPNTGKTTTPWGTEILYPGMNMVDVTARPELIFLPRAILSLLHVGVVSLRVCCQDTLRICCTAVTWEKSEEGNCEAYEYLGSNVSLFQQCWALISAFSVSAVARASTNTYWSTFSSSGTGGK